MPDPGPLAGEPRDRKYHQSGPARAGTWLVWWVLLMSLWIMLDDSLATDELLAGAGAAALAALVAELATYQAAARFRMRIRWLLPALRLPGQVAAGMVTVYAALWRRLARGTPHLSHLRSRHTPLTAGPADRRASRRTRSRSASTRTERCLHQLCQGDYMSCFPPRRSRC